MDLLTLIPINSIKFETKQKKDQSKEDNETKKHFRQKVTRFIHLCE